EVTAMGKVMERRLGSALNRSLLVKTELSELERDYSANESRIRLLVDSLGSEREGIISHAERVRASITDAHAILKVELASAGDQIRSSVDTASQQLSASLGKSGEEIVSRINNTGESIQTALEQKATAFSDHLASSTTILAGLLDGRISNLSETVSGVLGRIEDVSGSIAGSGSSGGEQLVARLNATQQDLSGQLQGRIEALGSTAETFA